MAQALGCLVVADRELPERFATSLRRCNVEQLPVAQVATSTQALAVAAAGEAGAFVVMDPRIEFLRPFTGADFRAPHGGLLTFASEERERLVDGPDPDAQTWQAVREAVGLVDPRALRCRGLGVWSGSVVREWRDRWLAPRGWTFDDALALSPDPQAWYLTWLLHEHAESVDVREPIVAVVDTPERVLDYQARRITRTDLARGYLGVLTDGPAGWLDEDGRAVAIGRCVPAPALARAALLRATRKAPRVQRRLGLSG